jgi:hypothetical protein
MTIKEEIVKGFKLVNPYSEAAFPPIKHGKFQDLVRLLETNGYSFDNLYGNLGRAVWNNCVMQVAALMDNYIEKDFLTWLSHRPTKFVNNDELLFYTDEDMYFPIGETYDYWVINIKK